MHGLISLNSFRFSWYLVLYVVGEKETTVKPTSTDVVFSMVYISLLCVGIPEIDS